MKELTRAEEQIMQVLWTIGKGVVKDVIDQLDDPKPAYNTVSTIIRILEQKGFVNHKAIGKSHEYFPLITKDEYSKRFMKGFVSRFFKGSYKEMVSFFADQKEMSLEELEALLEELKKEEK